MPHLHSITNQASPYWDSLVRVYQTSFPIDEQRPIESIARLIEHDERFVAYAIIKEDGNENYAAELQDIGHWPLAVGSKDDADARRASVATTAGLSAQRSVACNLYENYTAEAQANSQKPKANSQAPTAKVCANRTQNQARLNYAEVQPKLNNEVVNSQGLKANSQKPLGLLTTWHFEDFIYIEHFAIDPTLRSQGYGSEALKAFIHEHGKPIVLEAEPPTEALSIRRIRFYERIGLTLYDFPYMQPAYTPESNPVELRLMGTLDTNATPLPLVSQILHREVYGWTAND